MKKEVIILLIVGLFILAACQSGQYQMPSVAEYSNYNQKYVEGNNTPNTQAQTEENLGTLCSGVEQCQQFCQTNRGRCESYCRGKEIELCRIIFPPDPNDLGPQTNLGCTGEGTVTFTSPPMRIEKINFIEPIGLMIGGHITPIDHGYYYAQNWNPQEGRKDASKFVDILSPAKGIVTRIEKMPEEYASSSIGDYRIVIHHPCSFYTIYIHVNQVSEKLKTIADTHKTAAIEAGEVIGKAPAFDFSVHNDEITLKGFILPESYTAEPWKLHNADMFDYFAEPIRTQLLDRNIRQKEPRGGKIDYDIDGKLVGNWFEENTNGYFGKREYQRGFGYWNTHLAFAYDGLDPALIIVSIGDYNGEAKQFAVKGNAPDPAKVAIETGIIKYELVSFGYKTESGEEWDRLTFAKIQKAYGGDSVNGVALVKMLEDRKIKFEVFPGKKAVEVMGFTEKAKVYER